VVAITDNNNEYQLRDFKAVVEPTDELYCNDTNNETRVLGLNRCQSYVGGNGVIVPKGNMCRNPSYSVV
jgi:hypothetical protein